MSPVVDAQRQKPCASIRQLLIAGSRSLHFGSMGLQLVVPATGRCQAQLPGWLDRVPLWQGSSAGDWGGEGHVNEGGRGKFTQGTIFP